MNHAEISQLLKHRKHWVFDLDGTLTRPVHDFISIKKELGIPEDVDILGYIEQRPATEAKQLMGRLDDIEYQLAYQSTPQQHIKLLIQLLVEKQCQLAVLTRNSKENALVSLEQIDLLRYFNDEFVYGRAQAKAKPDPDGLLKISQQWQIAPEQLNMVGDYYYDLKTGRECNAMTIHFNNLQGKRWPELTDIHIEVYSELIDYLNN